MPSFLAPHLPHLAIASLGIAAPLIWSCMGGPIELLYVCAAALLGAIIGHLLDIGLRPAPTAVPSRDSPPAEEAEGAAPEEAAPSEEAPTADFEGPHVVWLWPCTPAFNEPDFEAVYTAQRPPPLLHQTLRHTNRRAQPAAPTDAAVLPRRV